MSVLICFKTMTTCQTPGTCSPHGGCRPDNESKHLDLGKFIDWIWSLKTESDQLKTENAGLKTGYEAYERVNAELRAECESLREIISKSATACGAAVSVDCSLEFMAMLPSEIELVMRRASKEKPHE